jgi:hypothetical protein
MSTTSSSTPSSNGSPNGSPNGGPPPSSNGDRPQGPAAPFRYSTRFKIIAVVVLAVVAVMVVVAYNLAADSTGDPVASSGGTREYVERIIPQNDSQVLQQGTVGVDLVTGWTGELTIDNVAIPASDLDADEAAGGNVASGLERITFTPGPGKVLEALPEGPVCAKAIVWDRSAGRGNSQHTVSWCFEVV